jgi:hypothetical protein
MYKLWRSKIKNYEGDFFLKKGSLQGEGNPVARSLPSGRSLAQPKFNRSIGPKKSGVDRTSQYVFLKKIWNTKIEGSATRNH